MKGVHVPPPTFNVYGTPPLAAHLRKSSMNEKMVNSWTALGMIETRI